MSLPTPHPCWAPINGFPVPTRSSRSCTSLSHTVPATLNSFLCSALFLLPRTPSFHWPPGKPLLMQQDPGQMPAGRSGAASAPAALFTQTFPRDSSRERPVGQALSGHPAALQHPLAAMSVPWASLRLTFTLEKNNLLYTRWRETDNFPDMCCSFQQHLSPVWVFPLGQG